MLCSRVLYKVDKFLRLLKWHSYSRSVCALNVFKSDESNYTYPVITKHIKVFDSNRIFCKKFSTSASGTISVPEYEIICNETLESLTDYFDVVIEENTHLVNTDITYGDGVLTVSFGDPHGTYVINRQSPNKQIWLSSPSSGPKRYDYDPNSNAWIYRHDNRSLHDLLQEEIVNIVQTKVDFHSNCSHSGKHS